LLAGLLCTTQVLIFLSSFCWQVYCVLHRS